MQDYLNCKSYLYDFEEKTLEQLLNKFFDKINNCIDEVNLSKEFWEFIKTQGLKDEVIKQVEELYNNGKLTELINKLANDVNLKLETLKEEVISQLEQMANQTVYYYLNNPNKLKLGNIIITKGFYLENDTKTSIYKIKSIVGNESFIDLGNGVLIGNDCSIKLNDTLKLKLLVDNNEVDIKQLGAIPNNKNISNEIIINYIFKNYRTVLISDKFYIKGSIIHQNNSVLKGINKNISQITLSDNINQYPIKSPNYDFNNFTMLFNEIVLEDITIDGNYPTNGKRNLTGNVNTGYYGAGTVICNVKDFRVNRVKIQNTEAWGLSFFLCKNLYVDDLEFNQKVGSGTNKDGISGSCENAYVNNVYGYTDDDLVAFTSGRGSIGGVSTGVNININQKNIIVDNIRGITKDGYSPWCGVCVYGTKSSIENIKITNVIGDYQLHAFRIGDYWYGDTNTLTWSIKNINISNCNVSANNGERIFKILYCKIDNFIIDKSEFKEINLIKSKAMLDFVNCSIGNIILTNSVIIANSSDTIKYYLLQQTSGGDIKNAIIEGITTNRNNTTYLTNTVICYFTNCESISILKNKFVYSSQGFYNQPYYIESEHNIFADFSIANGLIAYDDDVIINSIYTTFIGGALSIYFDITVNNIINTDKYVLKSNSLLTNIKFYHNVQNFYGKPSTSGMNTQLYFDKNDKVIKLLNPELNNTSILSTVRLSGSMILPTTFR